MTLCASAVPAPPPPPGLSPSQLLQPVDPVDSRDDIDLALAALIRGLPEIAADELETLLNDLSMPELGAKDGISVKEALEVSTHAI